MVRRCLLYYTCQNQNATVAVRSENKPLAAIQQKVQDYQSLVKMRLTLTVVFSSVMAYLIAAPGSIEWWPLFVLASGGFLVTAAANVLNQILEKDYDRLMKRTADRPLAADRMKSSEALLAAGFMSVVGISLLALFNPWTAFFGTMALVTYAFVYTPMKRISPVAVLIGAIPGALPTLIGVVAADGMLTDLALVLFAVQFFWQFPHFWAIGWLGYEDYDRAGYKLMPSTTKQRAVGKQSFLYALFLLPISLLPLYLGVSGLVSAIIAISFSLAYTAFSWNFYRQNNRKSALLLMFFSFSYIPVVLMAYFFDKL